jgi:Protein of unknown function (DUF2971)
MVPDRPNLLYHYTTQEGFLGIIKSKSLWASSIRHLNDASEFNYPLDIAGKIAADEKKNGKDTEEFERTLRMMRGLLNVHVCSFSTEKDQLSQWRAYCRDSSGFSIGFDAERLRTLAGEQDFTLDACIYDEIEHDFGIRGLIDSVLAVTDEKLPEKPILFLTEFMKMAPRMKHPSFIEEREWRLVNKTVMGTAPSTDILYRAGKSFVIPYREFRLGAVESVVKEIVVGPTPHPQLSIRTTAEFLWHQGIKGVEVNQSRVPFRSW